VWTCGVAARAVCFVAARSGGLIFGARHRVCPHHEWSIRSDLVRSTGRCAYYAVASTPCLSCYKDMASESHSFDLDCRLPNHRASYCGILRGLAELSPRYILHKTLREWNYLRKSKTLRLVSKGLLLAFVSHRVMFVTKRCWILFALQNTRILWLRSCISFTDDIRSRPVIMITTEPLCKVYETLLASWAFLVSSAKNFRARVFLEGLFLCTALRLRVLLGNALVVNLLNPVVMGLEIPHAHFIFNLVNGAWFVTLEGATFPVFLQMRESLFVASLALLQIAMLGSGTNVTSSFAGIDEGSYKDDNEEKERVTVGQHGNELKVGEVGDGSL